MKFLLDIGLFRVHIWVNSEYKSALASLNREL
jgi:hypothetical protein